jgi:TonB family protein
MNGKAFGMLVAAVTFCLLSQSSYAQSDTGAGPTPRAELADLHPPIYPPIARQARIAGDVRIQLQIRGDGSIASASIVDGHPMLKDAALASVQQSKFICMDCHAEGVSLLLTYTFGFRKDPGGADCSVAKRLRSSKCLYLWKCGLQLSAIPPRAPAVGQSFNRIIVLADEVCWEPSTADSSGD